MRNINTNNFDFLRVVFAFTVALAHLIELSEVDAFQKYKGFLNTRLAINGFFVISGFLIAKSYENSKSIKSYVLKRVRRIVPAYFFVILFSALSLSLISSIGISDYFLNAQFWKYLLANLTFQNYFEPCLPGVFQDNYTCTVNGALWTIKIEEAFYLLLPIFYFFTNSKNNKIMVFGAVVYVLSVSYFNYFVSIDMYRIAKQLPGALAFFVCGIVLFKNFNFFIKKKYYIILPCLIIFVLEHFVYGSNILKPIAFSFIVFYIAYSFRFLNRFGKYGDITYGVYIYHFPIIQLFVYFGFFKTYNPVIISTIFLILVTTLAALSWHFLELPYLSKGRKERQKKLLSS